MAMKFHVLAMLIVALPGAASGAFDPPPPVDTCRYFGEDFEQSARICMNTPNGARAMVCAMVLNNPSWTVVKADGGCAPVRETQPRTSGRALDYVRDYVQDKP